VSIHVSARWEIDGSMPDEALEAGHEYKLRFECTDDLKLTVLPGPASPPTTALLR
jgi:hypothetical protein